VFEVLLRAPVPGGDSMPPRENETAARNPDGRWKRRTIRDPQLTELSRPVAEVLIRGILAQ
jgi:hypothetical protein